jgi:hypothetical protein
MEKIKRANSLWTNDSLFLRKTLNIPIESDLSPTLTDDSFDMDAQSQVSNLTTDNDSQGTENRLESLESGKLNDVAHSQDLTASQESRGAVSIDLQSQSEGDKSSNADEPPHTAKSFLSRIDELIARSKDQMDSLTETGSEICKSVSEHDLFRVKTHLARRQHSMHSEPYTRTVSGGSTVSQGICNGVFSFRQLEQQQQDELFEL